MFDVRYEIWDVRCRTWLCLFITCFQFNFNTHISYRLAKRRFCHRKNWSLGKDMRSLFTCVMRGTKPSNLPNNFYNFL